MSSDAENLSPQEQQRVAQLRNEMNNNQASINHQQIAEAQLYDLHKSKEPEPHLHQEAKRNLRGTSESGGSESNMFHNDEAFERYQMGGNQKHRPAQSKQEEQAMNDYQSTRMNHKAGGTVKARAGEKILGALETA